MTDGCVQFSKNSWHYKITHFVFPSLFWGSGVNLCPYTRAVIASILSLPFVFAWRKLPYRIQDQAWIVQAELIFLTLVVLVAGFLDFMVDSEDLPTFLDMVGIGFFVGNFVGILGGLLVFVVLAFIDYINERPKKEHRTRGLIKTYMQSKHDKICPCIEFE